MRKSVADADETAEGTEPGSAGARHKNIIYNAMLSLFDDFRVEYRIEGVSVRILDGQLGCSELAPIRDLLLRSLSDSDRRKALDRGSFGKSGILSDCDIVLKNRRQIVEIDDHAKHFHRLRWEAIRKYPRRLLLGFDRAEYEAACSGDWALDLASASAIWNDVIRDFLPLTHDFAPTVRLRYTPEKFAQLALTRKTKRQAERDLVGLGLTGPGRISGSLHAQEIPAPRAKYNFDEAKNKEYAQAFKQFGIACWQWPLMIHASPSSHTGAAGKALREIFEAILEHGRRTWPKRADYEVKVGRTLLAACDIYVPTARQVIELDEHRHFTGARAASLHAYRTVILGFDPREYERWCLHVNAKDPTPIYRDGQRAWYDALRDHIPLLLPGSGSTRRPPLATWLEHVKRRSL